VNVMHNNEVASMLSGEKREEKEDLVIQTVNPVAWDGTAVGKIDALYDFEQLSITKVWTTVKVRGAGVDVFVLDTGTADHPAFHHQGQFDQDVFVKGMHGVKDGTGHGTWVAAKICGTGVGLAPKARLHSYQVLDESGTGDSSYSTAALNAVLDHPAKYKVVNMSLGSFQRSAEQERVLAKLAAAGVIVVCAGGNFNSSQNFYPAASPHTMAVAAYDDQKGKAKFSNYGDYIDVSAPGVSCYSAYLNGTFRKMSGTSMASPIVAGVLTLGLSYLVNKGKSYNREKFLDVFFTSLLDLGPKGRDPYNGFGGLNALGFIQDLETL